MVHRSVLPLVAAAAVVYSAPTESSQTLPIGRATDVANVRSKLLLGTAHGGALDLPPPTAAPVLKGNPGGPDFWTVSLFNPEPEPIATAHVDGHLSPSIRGGPIAAGHIAPGNSSFAVPKGYHGNIAFNKNGLCVKLRSDTGKILTESTSSLVTGDESQIEFSYQDQYKDGNYLFDINVSYV